MCKLVWPVAAVLLPVLWRPASDSAASKGGGHLLRLAHHSPCPLVTAAARLLLPDPLSGPQVLLPSLGLNSFMPFGWCRNHEARSVPKSMHSDLATVSAGCGFQSLSTWGNGSWSTPSWGEVLWHRCLFCLSVELQVYCWKESKNPT